MNRKLNIEEAVALSAVMPGSVIGEIDDGLINLVSSLDDIARGEVAGYNSRVVGGYRQLFPRLSKVDYAQLNVSSLPEVEGGLDSLLAGLQHVGAGEKAAFSATRKLVRQEMLDGSARLIIVPKVPQAMTEVELLEAEEQGAEVHTMGERFTPEQLALRAKKRTYTLAQLLTDHAVLPKYDLGLRSVETAKRIAATDPAAAAMLFQTMMNSSQQEVNVVVKAGDYSRDRVQARNAIRQMCKSAPRTDTSVETVVMMDNFVMCGPDGLDGWYVSGPLKNAVEVSFVYWLVRAEGPILPSITLALELVLLGIDIFDGESVREPELEHHALQDEMRPPPMGLSPEVAALVSVERRLELQSLRERLEPVYSSEGDRQLATAVRVSGKYVLVNSHVLDSDPGCTIANTAAVVKSQLFRDLCTVKSEGESTPWLLRPPRLGELAVICYLSDGLFSTSAPLKITSIDNSCVVTMLDDSVVHGMSGGALVAIEDMALLGVHSAATLTNLISYRFGESQFADLLDSDSVTTFSRHGEVGSFADKVVVHFKKRGLWNVFATAMEALEPVMVDNAYYGMAVKNGGHVYTTCDATQQLQLGSDRRVAVYESCGAGHYYRTPVVDKPIAPVYRRPPNYFEKVFILGFDDEVYISAQTSVTYIGPDARNFVIADLPTVDKPVLGGIVMGWDGAVLGCCGPRSMVTPAGLGYMCWPLAREELPLPTEPRAVLVAAFPFLNVTAWPDALLEEVFTHSSVARYNSGGVFNAGMRPLANLGDNMAKFELYKGLRDVAFPHSQWSGIMQSLQSNSTFASLAWKFGYANSMVVGSGVVMQKESKAYADLTEALLGAVALMEKPEVFRQFCSVLGILHSPTRPDLLRRPSELEY